MKKLFLFLALLILPPLANAQTIVTGNLINTGLSNVSSNSTYANFTLQNYTSQPRVVGTGIMVRLSIDCTQAMLTANTCLVTPNSSITPSGTYWRVTFIDKGVRIRTLDYTIGATFDLNSATPLSVPPVATAPTGDTTYIRSDAGNASSTTLVSTFPFGSLTTGKFNNIIFVDGVKYATVQAAVTAANGTVPVYVSPGTYVGPTTIPDGTHIIGMGDSIFPPEIWSLFNGALFNSFSSGSGSKNLVKFTYAASLSILNVSQIRLENIVLDFGGTGGLTIDGVNGSRFDMAVVNAATTAPAVTLKSNATYNSGNNHFIRLVTHGGNTGLKIQGVTNYVTESVFDDVHILASTQPSGTFTALDFTGNCDSNVFHKVQFWYSNAVTNLRGVVFNSSSATAVSGADGIYIGWYDETGAAFTGNSILVNPSNNNFIRTGILHGSTPVSITSWAGNSTLIRERMGDTFPSATNQYVSMPILVLDAGETGIPSLYFQQKGTTRWQIYDGASNVLYFNNGVSNLWQLNQAGTWSLDNGNFYVDINGVVKMGNIQSYGGVATVGSGIPAEYAAVDLTAQTAAVGTTTLYAVPAAGAGQYRLSWNAKVTTPATTGAASSTLGALTIVYTDPDGVVQTITAPASVAAGTIATTSAGNSTTTVLLGIPLLLNCKASTNITYAMAYVSDTANQMAYNLHISLEKM